MKLTVQEALKIGRLKEANILTGYHGISNKISSVTVMDVPNIGKWLKGEELILAAGYFEQCLSSELLLQLKEKHIAGIITKLKFTRKVKKELLDQCNELDIPIIIVPADCSWIEIINPLTEDIVRKQYKIIDESLKIHNILMKVLLHGKPLSTLSNVISNITNLPVAITDSDFQLISYSSNFDWEKATNNLAFYNLIYNSNLAEDHYNNIVSGYVFFNNYLNNISRKLFILPIVHNTVKYGYILICVDITLNYLNTMDIVKIEQLSITAALEILKRNEIDNTTRRYYNLLLDELLEGNINSIEDIIEISESSNKKFYDKYYVLVVNVIKNTVNNKSDRILQNQRINILYDLIKNSIDEFCEVLFFEKGENFVLLIPQLSKEITHLIDQLYTLFFEFYKHKKIYFGISDLHKIVDTSKAYKEAVQALKFAKIYHPLNYCFYSELGVLKFFMNNANNINKDFLDEIYDKYIEPIKKYDNENQTMLLKTLDVFIQNNFSKVDTAKKLFIHKNTLRARLSRIEQIIGCELSNNETTFYLQLALKIKYFYDNYNFDDKNI